MSRMGQGPMGGDPARRLALRVLARLERAPGRASQSVLREVLDGPDAKMVEDRDRGLATELVYGVLRFRLRLDAVLSRIVSRELPDDPEVLNLLRLGAYQLLLLDRIPPHAAVHATVEAARGVRGESQAKFVNGVLRNLDRQRPEPASLAEKYAHPEWMVERLRAELGSDDLVEARLAANVMPAPVALRLKRGVTLDDVPGGRASPVAGVVFAEGHESRPIRDGTARGRWIPQDPASARVVERLEVTPGVSVLELCAGRGVKSSQIVEEGGVLTALDLSPQKLAAARRLVTRWAPAGETALFIAADAMAPLPLDPELRFDRVLVDAPCSGLGVIRRRPETLWRRKPEDITALAGMQKAMLLEASRWVRPGGRLVYSVCTTTPEETTDVVRHLETDAERRFERLETHLTAPERDEMDGFYIAVFEAK
ncbi:MAG: 16S rRNA (cytosine(967)-C(5))-methyltransferase RsmB [Myxococcales bacterium]|nr:16S rRNA (cytosine(967)-C(5))-methyltransferase RsmB [Myxococcales bacterium]